MNPDKNEDNLQFHFYKNGQIATIIHGNRMITIRKRSKSIRCFRLVSYERMVDEPWHPCRPTRSRFVHDVKWNRCKDNECEFEDIIEMVKKYPPKKDKLELFKYRWKKQRTTITYFS